MVMVSVEVNVDLDEFSDEEILEEIHARDLDGDVDWEGLYLALHAGDKECAIKMLREIVQNKTARVLP